MTLIIAMKMGSSESEFVSTGRSGEAERNVGVEADGRGDGGGSMNDGVFAGQDDLAGCSGLNLH